MVKSPRSAAGEESDTDDVRLLSAARGGDGTAFARLYDRHHVAVFWQSYAVVRDADEAQDVTQEVFVTCWRRREEIVLSGTSLLPWLLVTAKFTAQNARRKQHRAALRSVPLDLDVADPVGGADPSDRTVDALVINDAIAAAVAALAPIDQKLFALCVANEQSYAAAAAELGMSHGTVRNRLSRLRRRLRTDLSDLGEEA